MGLFGFGKPREEGLVEEYGVVYLGGHPEYPKSHVGKIAMKVFLDRFVFEPTISTKGWFKGFVLPYEKVFKVEIVQRRVGTVEALLGGLDSRQLNQANNIHLTYEGGDRQEVVLRLEMLSGFTVMGQAKQCQMFMDRLRTNKILERFRGTPGKESPATAPTTEDIPSQIEKLAQLRDKGILSPAEFEKKKAELLSRM